MSGVDGVIVGNTTKRRAGLVPQGVPTTGREQRVLMEQGGFSGPTMFGQTLELVGRYRKMLDQHSLRGAEGEAGGEPAQKVIFASGGIKDGRQALQVLNAGASLAMLYTGLVYGGSGTVTRMKDELRREITAGKA
jgi:dihydroorotate dehydrogenase